MTRNRSKLGNIICRISSAHLKSSSKRITPVGCVRSSLENQLKLERELVANWVETAAEVSGRLLSASHQFRLSSHLHHDFCGSLRMSLSALSPWPDFFKRPIESVAPWQLRLRAIGGPSARFHQSARSGTQGPGADLVNIPGFAAWKDALAQAVRDKVEKAVIDEFGPRPGDQHMDQQQAWRQNISDMKHRWYYDLGEQVKELWLKVRDKSVPTLLAFFLALSHVRPPTQSRWQ